MTDFRRRKWRQKGTTNSIETSSMSPRIAMILAIDSLGNAYFSLLQCNTNEKIMEIFFKNLVSKLDFERNGWRSDTIILLDNAPYH